MSTLTGASEGPGGTTVGAANTPVSGRATQASEGEQGPGSGSGEAGTACTGTLKTGTAHVPISRADQSEDSVMNSLLSLSGGREEEHCPTAQNIHQVLEGFDQWSILNSDYTLESHKEHLNTAIQALLQTN